MIRYVLFLLASAQTEYSLGYLVRGAWLVFDFEVIVRYSEMPTR